MDALPPHLLFLKARGEQKDKMDHCILQRGLLILLSRLGMKQMLSRLWNCFDFTTPFSSHRSTRRETSVFDSHPFIHSLAHVGQDALEREGLPAFCEEEISSV
ncbi:hypothetical protein TNCV_2100181 [Trichonephila clavipes]|nr:hypothetical protein TNCV_2100181 [Trichonephila clavipes]